MNLPRGATVLPFFVRGSSPISRTKKEAVPYGAASFLRAEMGLEDLN